MKSRKSRNQIDEVLTDDDQLEEPRPRRGRSRKRPAARRRKLPWLLLLVLVVIALSPTIVAKTPLRNVVLSALLPTKNLRVSVGGASLSWFSPPSFEQVQVWDAAGERLFAAESIRGDRAPGNLLLDRHQLGTIEIVHPAIYLKIRADGNNLEDALSQVLAEVAPSAATDASADSPSPPLTVSIMVFEGTVFVEDVVTARRWRIESIEANYYNHADPSGLGRGTLAGRIASIDAQNAVVGAAGEFAIEIKPDDANRENLSLKTAGLSLGLADAWLRRYVTGTELSGTLSGEATATWTANGKSLPADLVSSGTLIVDRLDATAPALAGDRVRLARVELPWRVAAGPSGIVIEDMRLVSDVGNCAVRGTIVPSTLDQAASTTSAPSLADAASRSNVELRGSLDVARLTAMLPHALRIRSDTTITSGTVQLAAHLQPDGDGQVVTGSLQTAALTATSAGREIRWDQPVSANFALRRQQGTVRLDALKCDSDFLKIDASGTPQQMAATAQFDLNRLAEHVGQFVDLRGVALAGTGSARLDLRQTAPDEYTASATGEFAQLQVAIGSHQFATVQSKLSANLRAAGPLLEISEARIDCTQLRAASPGWSVVEPRAELAGDLSWDGGTGVLTANSMQLVTSAVSLITQNVRYRAPRPDLPNSAVAQLSGIAAFRTDLARLAAWRSQPQQTPNYQPSGQIEGQARFQQQGDRITGELNATGENLALAQWAPANANSVARPAYQTIWQEPQLTIRSLAAYDSPSDQLTLEQLQIQSNTLQAAATGQVAKLSTAAEVQLSGTVNYDLAQVTPLLRPYLGEGIQLVGREQAQFALAGQLNDGAEIAAQQVGYTTNSASSNPTPGINWSRRVRAQLQVPWSGANVYGLPIGPGKLAAALGDGAIRIEPLSLSVGEGQLTAAPTVRLDPPPAELTLPGGPLITNVRISPEVSEAMLKFVAPVLAGATQSEGLFSMTLEGARLPLGEPARADTGGQLTVHSVRVVPGPMAQQWVGLAQQIESLARRRDPAATSNRQVTLLTVKDQQVNFRVVDGRVYHQNMEFQVGDVMLRSQGSVGLDETVSLTLSVPIQDAWVAKEPLLSGLKGQSLQIPVSGTLTRPKLDERAISGLTQQLLQGAAEQAIGGELNKALDKLFKPKQ